MNAAAKTPVSLPRSNPTASYWQSSPFPASEIADLRTTPELPTRADYVIVGSGISGASIAHEILRRRPGSDVVILEARQACSGATGRNGGHTKAASYRSFLEHERELGTAEAIKIAQLEYDNIRKTHSLARHHGFSCDSLECDTVDIIYSQKQLKIGLKAIARMREIMGDVPASHYTAYDAEQTRQRFGTSGTLGSFQYAAGSIHAHAFATGMLRAAISQGANVQTSTPVLTITAHGDKWELVTDRGNITTKNVILATNGYTAHLLPQMQGLIVPLQGQVLAIRPGSDMPQNGLPVTYSFIYETGYEYMITRPHGTINEGDIIIGGGIHQLPDSGASRYGNTDDTTLDPTITAYLRGCTRTSFEHWGDDNPAGRTEWSGIMGATADGLPYVGQVPSMPGLFISAGFNGHGMVLCLKSAEALATIMLGNEEERSSLHSWFPESFLISQDRLNETFDGRKDLKAPAEPVFGTRSSST